MLMLAAFALTEEERSLSCSVPLDADAGLALTPLDIDRWAVPSDPAELGQLDPADAALLESEEDESSTRGALRGKGGELSWLLRTSYLAAGSKAHSIKGSAAGGRASRDGAASAEGEPRLETYSKEERVAAIHASFEQAQSPPVHATDPSLYPVEVLPILPAEEGEERSFVLALFESDPLADAPHLAALARRLGLPGAAAGLQLKSFKQRSGSGHVDHFVAGLALQEPAVEGAPGAEALEGSYKWLREYDSNVRYDSKNATFLFRFAEDHVAYHDLNTKLALRKRQRAVRGDDEDAFLQPEKVILRVPREGEDGESGEDVPGPSAVAPAGEDDWGSEASDGGEPEGDPVRAWPGARDAFGDEDDDL
ncbi:hypothetical protein H632_c854p2 [Helicosporidium sp. ATCC 50920]|nr:hypothetical protein H632_c854p2 [Helicosporidium sp. ATCC 50920]|eukprot:KDD75130.1 hypothetical protein H632_c854p2 [Helicosporidium sp. ATCC 50920]